MSKDLDTHLSRMISDYCVTRSLLIKQKTKANFENVDIGIQGSMFKSSGAQVLSQWLIERLDIFLHGQAKK